MTETFKYSPSGPVLHNYQPILWGILHGLNDFTAGFMLAHFTFITHDSGSFLFIILYSIIGFGGQLPLGFWIDHKKQLKPFAWASVILLPLAILTYFINPGAGIVISGLASALVHVTGGAVCLQVHKDKAGPLALFTAPGVLGLTLGGVLGHFGAWQLLPVALIVIFIGFLVLKNKLPEYQTPQSKISEMDTHDWLMLGILLLMCFRSFIFDVINHVAHDFENGILIIGISAFLGKIIGGFVADKIGWKKFVYITLPIALLLFQFGKENIYALGFGIACLQSSVPLTLLLMGKSLPFYPATATAMSLGTSIALAGFPIYLLQNRSQLVHVFNDAKASAMILTILFLCWVVAERFVFKQKLNLPA